MRKHFTTILPIFLLVPVFLFARSEGQFDRTLQVSGSVSLDLTTGSGEVMIKTGGSNQVVVHGRVHSSNDWFGGNADSVVHSVESNPPIEQNGNSIRIGYNLPEDAKRHVSISYEITVPRRYHGSGGFRLRRDFGSGRAILRKAAYRFRRHPGAGRRPSGSRRNRERHDPRGVSCGAVLRRNRQRRNSSGPDGKWRCRRSHRLG